jgi:cell division protein FtsW
MAFAQIMCKFGKKMKSFKFGVLPFAVITMFIVALLYRQPHISAIVIIVTIASVMMLAGGTQLRWFLLLGIFLLTLMSAIILPRMYAPVRDGEPPLTVSEAVIDASRGMGYAGERISTWLDPDADPLNAGFQTRQSLLAIGSGGLFGQGLGQSRQKFLYLPEEHNDFIFAVISEELGFIGALLILTLFTLLIIRGYWLSFRASDKYGSLIVFGITSLLAIQVFFNVAVVTNIIPATGISLPFFSYGGTALLLQLVQIGIVLSVSREIGMERPKKQQESGREKG